MIYILLATDVGRPQVMSFLLFGSLRVFIIRLVSNFEIV